MAIHRFDYRAPKTLQEALSLLDENRDQARILAGGTDLVVQMKQGLINPALIVDVKKIPELNRLKWNKDEGIHIGAAVPISDLIVFSPLISKYSILVQACSVLGSVQVRNWATLG